MFERLRASTSREELEDLGVAMAVLAGSDKQGCGLGDVIKLMLPKELALAALEVERQKASSSRAVAASKPSYSRRCVASRTAAERSLEQARRRHAAGAEAVREELARLRALRERVALVGSVRT